MRRTIPLQPRFPVLGLVLALAVWGNGCTLPVPGSFGAPPETWRAAQNTHPDGESFQEMLDAYARDGLPGVALFVRTPDGQWNGAAGFARIESSERMLPTHRHHAASITKMYTATAVLLQVEDGRIRLDNPIREYLPESVHGQVPNGGLATVRQLLDHTSGIPDFSGAFGYDLDFFNDPTGDFSVDRLLSFLHGQSPIFEPGRGYFYSNANYLLLSQILDGLDDGGHGTVFTRRVLRPLALSNTFYKDEAGYPSIPGLVNSYQDLAGDGVLLNVSDLAVNNLRIFSGNAGLVATSADFAEFIEALLGGRLVGEDLLAEMMEWGDRSRYGLGLNYIETPFGKGVGHSGADFGVLGQVRHFPDHSATLVLLANAGDSGKTGELFWRLWNDTLERTLGRP